MGNTVSVDVTNDDLFKPYKPPLVKNGKHLFEVANNLTIEKCANSDNKIIKVENRCQDEDDDKGKPVYDHFIIMTDLSTEGKQKAKKINEGRLAQFTVACGVLTQEQIKAGEDIPLEAFLGCRFNAITKTESSKDPNTGQERTNSKIARYLFEAEKEATS